MNLWPVEHFFPHFFSRSALISTDLEKSEEKCSTGQRFICTEVTSCEIHTLAVQYEDVHVLESFRRPCIDCENL